MGKIFAYRNIDFPMLAMGVSFQDRNHCSGDRGTAPKSNVIMVAAPQSKVAVIDLAPLCLSGEP